MIEDQKELTQAWFQSLRDQICHIFEVIEQEHCARQHQELKPAHFTLTPWTREKGGGGTMGLMKGQIFEKVGVNVSTVWGEFSPKFQSEMTGAKEDPRFWASGISVVAHMVSPLVPAIHMNTRFIVTSQSWFGGGVDMTPYFSFPEDSEDFHHALQQTCDIFDLLYYPRYKKWCDDYFFLPHRNEPRGIGGIFFDNLDSGSWEQDFSFTQSVGKTFLDIYSKIVRRRCQLPWTIEQREYQLQRRGRYVEFNLLYDRGTRFGLMTEGNIDAILMSMPPQVIWP